MIITVTMNPAIDKTVELEQFHHEGLNRLQKVVIDAGGKGINVSKTIQELGGETIATGFLGGTGGAVIKKVLYDRGITTDFVSVEGETRTNMKVVEPGGVLTELNEPGPSIRPQDVEALLKKLESYAGEDTLFVLAGSIPAGVDTSIYGQITRLVQERGAKVFLDADGELFVKALEAGPDMIKPNKFELEQYFAFDGDAGEEDLIAMGKRLAGKGIERVAISMGKEGAMFFFGDKVICTPGLKVEAHSTVGAGDAMVAALSYGFHEKVSEEECIRLGVAASAGAVMTIGTKPPSKDLVEKLKGQVTLQYK